MLAVANIAATLSFYQTVLGFAPTLQTEHYSIVERDGPTIHFQRVASEEVLQCVRGHAEIYIEVSNIRALWEHVKTFKSRYRIRDLLDRGYGMTEFQHRRPEWMAGVCWRANAAVMK